MPVSAARAATSLFSQAACAHAAGKSEEAFNLIVAADCDVTRQWASTIMGRVSISIHGPGPKQPIIKLPQADLDVPRMPGSKLKEALILRDGWNCRFCGLDLICRATLNRIKKNYPDVVGWKGPEVRKHALLRVVAAQFDHLLPHSRGGRTTLDNMVMTCAPCNYGRGSWTLEECRLNDPLSRPVVRADWDGLVGQFRPISNEYPGRT